MLSRITSHDPYLVVVSFLWIGVVILLGELVRRGAGQPPDLTRKFIHIGVGFWALPTALLFESAGWAALCPMVFIPLNAISYRFRLMEVIEEEGRGSPGTIYFPIAFVALILVFWPLDHRPAMVAGLFAMAFGDAAASIVGRRWGRHRFRMAGNAKSWEGSAAMFGFSFASILLGTWALLPAPAWLPSLAAAGVATAAEAPVGRGLDNLTVPAGGALAFWAVSGLS